jgi:hypothetical protein
VGINLHLSTTGGAMFTDYSMTGQELAIALEERGCGSIWAPEHSHIPLTRKTPFPGGGDLPKQYADAMDPFVYLPNPPGALIRRAECREWLGVH